MPTLINCRECGTLEHIKFKSFIPADQKNPQLFYFLCDQCDHDTAIEAAYSSDEAVEVWNERQCAKLDV